MRFEDLKIGDKYIISGGSKIHTRGEEFTATDSVSVIPVPDTWPDPTPEILSDPLFNRIWDTIKYWDINVPGVYEGYTTATGNHARAIYEAIKNGSS